MTFPSPRHGPGTKIDVSTLSDYPERIDVRSPAEFALDHIPRAINLPVLSDEERKRVGTLHAQDSAFAARKIGAALVARNIAAIIETHCISRPREWAPVVYCWRGGKRSASLAHILCEIGWRAVQLDGGYRSWRRHVIAMLATVPARFRYIVVCGLTGSGKSRLLAALDAEGAQVLDLEKIARHRGSLLGDLPGDPQPSQRGFDTDLLAALERFDPARPVYVESESRKIGTVQVPDALLDTMRAATCVRVDTPQPLRVALLKDEYTHYLADSDLLAENLRPLVPVHGRKTIDRWVAAASAGDFDTLVSELLAVHYDPTYARSMDRNYPRHTHAVHLTPHAIDPTSFRALARDLEAQINAAHPVPA